MNEVKPFEVMQKHYQQRDLAAREWRKKGGKTVGYFCNSVPEEMILAAGFFPIRLSGDPWGSTDAADRYTEPSYEGFVRSMFDMLLIGRYDFLDYLIIPHSRDSIVSWYGFLLEIKELESNLKLPVLYLLDTLHTRSFTSELYNRDRICELSEKLEEWSGKVISDKKLSEAIAIVNENRMLLKKLADLRAAEPPLISGVEALQIIGSSVFMLKEEHNRLLARFLEEAGKLPIRGGARLFISGSPHDNLQFYETVESCGATVVAEDSCWGNRYSDNPVDTSSKPIDAIADRYLNKAPCPWMYPMASRVGYCLAKALEAKAQGAIFFLSEGDYVETWDYPDLKKALEDEGIHTICFKNQKYLLSDSERERMEKGIKEFVENIGEAQIKFQPGKTEYYCRVNKVPDGTKIMVEPKRAEEQPKARDFQAQKSRKQLRTTVAVSAHQKKWFLNTKERIDAGEPLAICGEGECEEIFMVMDIPVICTHWWSAQIAAKQLAPRYFDLLDKKGYDQCRYCSLGLGCTMDHNPEMAPWGGLPKPTVIVSGGIPLSLCDARQRINDLWAREYDAFLFPLDVTTPTRLYHRSWEKLNEHWDEVIEPHRIDLRVTELRELIRFLEVTTGKTFSMARLTEVMELVNKQNEYLTKASDLISGTVPCPVRPTDSNSVYRVQWHRGTQAGLDLARMFYEEVQERVANGMAAFQNEKLRLGWSGVGLWHNTAFNQYFEEKYGAVFVGGYIGAAAGYPRKFSDDPLRALASRSVFLGIGGTDTHVREAKLNKLNGVIQLVRGNCREDVGTPLVRAALEAAGIPVLPIYADNVDSREWDDAKITSLVSEFIEKRLLP